VETARGKLQSVWDLIFRLQVEHVAESAKLKSEITALNQQVPKLQTALEDLRHQNDALRIQNADWKHSLRLQIGRFLEPRAQQIRRLLRAVSDKLGSLSK
jgi:FtsZ-binding cell division protein ZapB